MPGLIPCPPHIWLAVAPVDMRKGADGLSAIVQQALGQPPCAGDTVFPVTEAQWYWLVAGVDWQSLSAVPSAHWQA